MGGTLAAHVAAINEFRDVLDEESISKLSIDDSSVEFSVQTSSKLHFVYQSSSSTYPRSSALVFCKNKDNLDLEILNAKLSKGQHSIAKALSLLGRQLNVDLDWALEALEEDADGDEGGVEGDEEGGSIGAIHEDEDVNMSEDDEMSDQDVDTLREWSQKVLQLKTIEDEKILEDEKKEENNKIKS